MTDLVKKAIKSVEDSTISFCRFITGNDTGTTGSHQSGFYIPKTSSSIFFPSAKQKGSNDELYIKIKWQDDFETDSRAIYYGRGTRNEYRLTRFGRDFPFLEDEYTGSLLIIVKIQDKFYYGYVLSTENDIEDFLNYFNMSPVDTNSLIGTANVSITEDDLINYYVSTISENFPETKEIADEARKIYLRLHSYTGKPSSINPDKNLLSWIKIEFEIFKKIENSLYAESMKNAFSSVDEFTEKANSILNRRKSRAGKSLEHHLDNMFSAFNLAFSHPGKTEHNKKPDFIFPGNEMYHDTYFDISKLTFLGAKTTCKDRWRQILNEADKISNKHLFTLQQGISKNQLDEMHRSQVTLVVPEEYISTYPIEYREKILNLKDFISLVKSRERN